MFLTVCMWLPQQYSCFTCFDELEVIQTCLNTHMGRRGRLVLLHLQDAFEDEAAKAEWSSASGLSSLHLEITIDANDTNTRLIGKPKAFQVLDVMGKKGS